MADAPDAPDGAADALAELIDRYCGAWSDPDAGRRAAVLAEVWAEEALYADPMGRSAGRAALLARITEAQARWPGLRIERTSPVDGHHGFARFLWRAVLADGSVMVEGLDVATLAPDGRTLAAIVGFFGPLDTAPARG